ncbi:hypothetical protein [Chryseobacterium capnotolerans]|nr:hypothetical protein [Chryseobacterium capnotolerans]
MNPFALSSEAMNKLTKYPFPGNVRELKSVIDLACVMADDNEIQPEDIHFNPIGNKEDLFISAEKTLKQFTTEIILYHLKKNNNDVMKTAQVLDIGKSTIYNLLQNK